MRPMTRLAKYRKAIVAFVASVLVLAAAFGLDLTGEQTAAILGVVSTLGVLLTPNADPADQLGWSVVDGEPVPD